MEPLQRTERLDVHALRAEHFAPMLAVYGDADAMRFVGDGSPAEADEIERWLAVTETNVRTRGYGMCALVERATGEVVGFAGLVHPGGQPEPELKYALLRAHWGRGLATEAARGLVAWGRRRFAMDRIIATVDPEHVVSQGVLRKAGFRRVADRIEDDGLPCAVFEWRAGTEQPGPA